MHGRPLRAAALQRTAAPAGPDAGLHAVLWTVGLLVVIRFFTEVVPVLPGPAKLVDVPLVALLAGITAVHPRAATVRGAGFLLPVVAFVAIATASTILNASRVSPGPVLLFLYGFLAPLAAYGAAYKLWPAGRASSFSRLLVWLGVLQLVVVALHDLPLFVSTGNPDEIAGTFGENPYQLVFFLIVFCALLAGIVTSEPRRRVARLAPLLVLASLAVAFMAQYRALLIAAAATIVLLTALLATAPGRAKQRGLFFAAFTATAFLVTLAFVAVRFPTTKYEPYLAEVQQSPLVFVEHRLEALGGALEMFEAKPETVPVGSGPGTFSSRAWETFANYENPERSAKDPVSQGINWLTGGTKYRTDVSDRFSQPRLVSQEVVLGSRALSSPFSSYTSLLAEVGLLGLLVFGGIYVTAFAKALVSARRALRERAGPVVGLALAAVAAFALLLQMAFLGNWLEVARLTIPSWILLAVVVRELATRPEGA